MKERIWGLDLGTTSIYGVSEADAKTLSELVLPQGWLSHSEKAIRSLLPHLEKGLMYSEACDIAYPNTGMSRVKDWICFPQIRSIWII